MGSVDQNELNPSDSEERKSPKYVLIDTDPGGDDAWALFMAIRAHRDPAHALHIVAITTVNGNASLDHVNNNVTRVLETVGASDIPVYSGAKTPLVLPFVDPGPPYFGKDGFGDANLPPISTKVAPGPAANVIVSLAEKYQGNLSILALGPLTNLGLAIRLNPYIKLQELFIMGGNIFGIGNTTPNAEFNFLVDPEGARVTLENYKCPIFLAPWEVTLKYSTTTKAYRVKKLGKLNTPEIKLLNAIEAKILQSNENTWNTIDPVPTAWMINPKIVTQTEKHYCTVELNGSFTRGMMVVDRRGQLGHPPNATILTAFDTRLFKRMLRWAAGGAHF